jgi:hypothetical protein
VRICHALLSPTFGMHEYTADLAKRMAHTGHDVYPATMALLPRDRYAPDLTVYTPVDTLNIRFSVQAVTVSVLFLLPAGRFRPDS